MIARFQLDHLVDLGGGWYRVPEPGEELYRIDLQPIGRTKWVTEERLSEVSPLLASGRLESTVWPGTPPADDPDAPDPRQMDLPLGGADGDSLTCAECSIDLTGEGETINACGGCGRDYCDMHALGHHACPYTEEL